MTINETAEEVFRIAKEKGWHESHNLIPESLMKMVTELAEAMEEYRNGKPSVYITPNGKPEGMAVEMADCVIRIMDAFIEYRWDLEKVLKLKMEYNKTREYRHGGKVC